MAQRTRLILKTAAVCVIIFGAALVAALHRPAVRQRSALPSYTFYTAQTATTPQAAFWAAVRDGEFDELFSVHVETWRDLDTLKTLLLSGKGDIWLGHLEGFALAKKHGAPLSVIAVTAWKKFYLLSTDPSVNSLEDCRGKELAYVSRGSPAVPIAQAILGPAAAQVTFVPQDPPEAAVHLASGKYSLILAPEPLVTLLLSKVKNLRRAASLEEELAKKTGGKPRLPLAGIAVNINTIGRNRALVSKMLSALAEKSKAFEARPKDAAAVLPESVSRAVGADILAESLNYDKIMFEHAEDVQQEIENYLRIVEPDLTALSSAQTGGSLGPRSSFIWRKDADSGS